MLQNINIYPSKGFLNTDFKIKSEQSADFSIYYNGTLFEKGFLTKGSIQTLPRFRKPGEYTILSILGGEEVRHTIQVEDALRLGSSELKNAYVFDDFKYIVFVMKDRIHFFDLSLNTYVYTENFLSPQQVFCVNSQLLLFVTEHSEGTSISLFDSDSFSIITSIECDSIVAHNECYSIMYIKRGNDIIRINTEKNLAEVCHYNVDNNLNETHWIDKSLSVLYVFTNQYVHCIDFENGEEGIHEIANAIGITQNGYIIYCTGQNTYKYCCMLPNFENEGTFIYRNVFARIEFDGHPIANDKWGKRNDYGFESYFEASKNELKDELKKETNEKIKSSSKSVQSFDCLAKLLFYPTTNGVYIVENMQWKYYTSIRYLSFYDSVEYISQTQYETNLLWIGNDLLQVKYKNHSYSLALAVKTKGNKASFAINETTSALLENGIIKSTYEGAMTASKEISESTEKIEDEIIVNGEKISSYYIQCKNAHKLLLKRENQYMLYELDNQNVWKLRNSIPVNELRYERAALSPDGKYVLYSMRGNQYALYNIERQEEEIIRTGNFVDFDKDGNHIVADEKRQLRIYDPKTFKWVKDCPDYYTFVSPDGKLYAKTMIKEKYFNLAEGKEISKDEYNKLESKYDREKYGDQLDSEESEHYKTIRWNYINSHYAYFSSLKDEKELSFCVLNDRFFSHLFLQLKHYVTIGITKTRFEKDIPLDTSLSYLNYICFSYDNKHVGIVGKPSSNGYLKLLQINFDEQTNDIEIEREICDMEIAKRATWTCSFNRNGLFGTYDSIPNLYLINKDDYAKFNEENSHEFGFLKKNFGISNRSLLCFSNSGKYMALSSQGYEPISLGGKGHLPSNRMFIHSTEGDYQLLDKWEYQGQAVSKRSSSDLYRKNLIQAGFSANDDKILTVSGDGVIVIRNLHLEELRSDK